MYNLLLSLFLLKEAFYANPHQAIIDKVDERVKEIRVLREKLRGSPAEPFVSDFSMAAKESGIPPLYLIAMARQESSLFRRDSCRNSGGANGFGYASNEVCFKDYKEAIHKTAKVLAGYKPVTLREKICIWNTGKAQGGKCEYAEKIERYAR